MGFSDKEWSALSTEQKYEARLKQSEIDERKRQEKAKAKALKEKNERQHQQLIAMRYQNAKHGDIIQCVMKNAVIDYSKGWKNAESLGFTLVRGENKTLKAWSSDKKNSVDLYAGMSEDAMDIKLCRFQSNSAYQERKYCKTLTATTNQYDKGVEQAFDIKKYMHGRLFCSLKSSRQQNVDTKIEKLTIKNVFKTIFD